MITVRWTKGEQVRWQNPAEEQKALMEKLRSRGIPMLGAFVYIGLERGTLTERRDWSGDLVYTWSDV